MLIFLALVSALVVVSFTLHAARSGTNPRRAIAEAWVNILIGFSINYAANLLFLPLVGANVTPGENWCLGWIYTAVSMFRQYAIRRWFQVRIEKLVDSVSGEKANG